MNREKRDWTLYCLVLFGILFLFFLSLLVKKGFAETSIDFALVDNSVYSKVMNTSQKWDKYIKYTPDNKLTLWNEIWLKSDVWSIDTNYRVNLNDSSYRGILTGNYTRAINKFHTVEVGGGAYFKGTSVYPTLVASNRFLFNFTFELFGLGFTMAVSDFNYLYFPIPQVPEMRNDIKIKAGAIFTKGSMLEYFSFNFRQEFIDNTFSNMNYGSLEVKF